MELTQEQVQALATIAAFGGSRSRAGYVANDEIRNAAKAMASNAKRAINDNSRGRMSGDDMRAEWKAISAELFDAIDNVRDAFKTRHDDNGITRFRLALDRYHVAFRTPIPWHVLRMRDNGNALLNYARKHWHNYGQTNERRSDIVGYSVTTPRHKGIPHVPEDAVQAALLHIVETGGYRASIPVGEVFRSIKLAAYRMSRGRDVWTYTANTHAVSDYNVRRHWNVLPWDFETLDGWKAHLRAEDAHRRHNADIAGRMARIVALRDARRALLPATLDAYVVSVNSGLSITDIAKLSARSVESLKEFAESAGKVANPDVTFLPAIPEDRDPVSREVEETMIRRGIAHRRLIGKVA